MNNQNNHTCQELLNYYLIQYYFIIFQTYWKDVRQNSELDNYLKVLLVVVQVLLRRTFFMAVVTPDSTNPALESKLISINAFSTPEEIAEAEKKNEEIKKQFEKQAKSAKKSAKTAKKQADETEKASKEIKTNGKKKKSELKTRFFSGVVYPESLPADWVEKLKSFGWPGEISPLHNLDWQLKDLRPSGNDTGVDQPDPETLKGLSYWYHKFDKCYSDGKEDSPELKLYKSWKQKLPESIEDWQKFDLFCQFMRDVINPKRPKEKRVQIYKKAHYHWILITDKRMTVRALTKRLQRMLGERAVSFSLVQPIKTEVANIDAYLCHKSLDSIAMHKHQYDESDKIVFNGFDVEAFRTYAPEQKKYCLTIFGNLSILAHKMSELTGTDLLMLTNLYRAQVIMASTEPLNAWLRYAIYQIEFALQLTKKDKKLISLDDKAIQKDNVEPILRKKFDQASLKFSLKLAKFLFDSLNVRHDWPSQTLFMQSYISYRNYYIDYFKIAKGL